MARMQVRAEVTGKVWKLLAQPGATVGADEPLMIVESMKMEIPVSFEQDSVLVDLLVGEGDAVEDGQVVAIVET